MPLPGFVLDQLSQPRGRLAPLTGWFLNGVNARTIVAGVAALELREDQRVVEVGFGGGLSLPLLLRAVGRSGRVVATETSPPMLARANRWLIVPRLQGRVRLEQAVVESLPLADSAFDAIMSLNTIMFWTDVEAGIQELARVLVPGGRCVLGVADPEHTRAMGFGERGFRVIGPEPVMAELERAGFERVERTKTADGTWLVVGVRGRAESDQEIS